MTNYLADKGHRILRNGYNIIPILPGEKRPSISAWQKMHTTENDLAGWKANGRASHGIGITTALTPLFDVDCCHTIAAEHMKDWILKNVGQGAVRIGRSPKVGILFRCATPFKKITSKKYTDPDGNRSQLEILGDGQQCVIYHIHPETHQPYWWSDKNYNPEVTRADQLVEVTQADGEAAKVEFERYMEELGWPREGAAPAAKAPAAKTPTSSPRKPASPADDDAPPWLTPDADDLDPSLGPIGLTEDQLRELVKLLPNNGSVKYDGEGLSWMNVMGAIHDESQGAEWGRSIAREYSDRFEGTEEPGKFDKTWNSLGKGEQRPVTARLLVKLANALKKASRVEKIDDLINDFDLAKDFAAIEAIIAECRKIEINELQRPLMVNALQSAFKRRTNTVLTVATARELIRYRPTGIPDWLNGWVYLTHAERFYNRKNGEMITARAFDAAFGRFVGNDATASKYALDTVKVPISHMTIYLPSQAETFTDQNGLSWINTYRDTSPPVPAVWTRPDLRNVYIIEEHFSHLFDDEREVELLISVLAYIVQTRKRVNWMAILQGEEGIGKTFIAILMNVVLGGSPHVYKLDTEVLTKSPFTDWTAGHQFVFIEEIKVHGHQYDVMNKLKPLITDDTLTAHIKNISPYNVPNVTTYMGATNHQDAIPIIKGETRYFPMQSRWQDPAAVAQFKKDNPNYFVDLYRALEESPGAIRKWLLEYKLHPEFSPVNRAPYSHVKAVQIEHAKPEMQYAIEDLIEEGETAGVSNDIIVVHLLREALREESESIVGPEIDRKELARVLKGMGFKQCEQRQVIFGQRPNRRDYWLWSKNPALISATGIVLRKAVEKSLSIGEL